MPIKGFKSITVSEEVYQTILSEASAKGLSMNDTLKTMISLVGSNPTPGTSILKKFDSNKINNFPSIFLMNEEHSHQLGIGLRSVEHP